MFLLKLDTEKVFSFIYSKFSAILFECACIRWRINCRPEVSAVISNVSILQVLAESDQLRKEADDLGPRAELEHWKKRMTRFNYLLDQLKSPDVKAALGVVLLAKSKLIKVRCDCHILLILSGCTTCSLSWILLLSLLFQWFIVRLCLVFLKTVHTLIK